jgi:hypothetical protein
VSTQRKLLRKPTGQQPAAEPTDETAAEQPTPATSGRKIVCITTAPLGWKVHFEVSAGERHKTMPLVGWLTVQDGGRMSTLPAVFHGGAMVPAQDVGTLTHLTDSQHNKYC